jgi:hypothetical protein
VSELKGSLTGVGLPAVVQLIGELRHTGTLHLTEASKNGALAFENGRLVAAECGQAQGLQAVAHCALDLPAADFSFFEGTPTAVRTLDLGPADLNKLLTRIGSTDFSLANGTAADHQEPEAENACAMLGFADDRGHHYSRSTALHRCYVSGAPSLVSAQEQRELCLSGRFAACPRFRNSGVGALAEPAALRATLTPQVPPGVAARMAAASQMHLSSSAAPAEPAPETSPPQPPPSAPTRPGPHRHWPLFIAGGATAGLALLLLLALFALPALRGGLAQRPATPSAAASTATSETRPPVSTNTAPADAPVVGANAVARAAAPPRVQSPSPTSSSSPPRPTQTIRAADARSLMDLRFVSGPAERWLKSPPYATWSDGAYRLLARDATRFVAVGVPIDQALGDVIVSATFRKTGGPPGGGYGLIVRDQGPEPRDGINQDLNAYVLETGDLGEYGVWRRDGDHWVDLVPWTPSTAIRSGGSPNDLVVRAEGDQLTFTVNGTVVAVVNDDTYPQGGVGLFVGGDNNDVALDRFNVQLAD